MYFERSFGVVFDQTSWYAFRAALTAKSTSLSFAQAISDRTSSVAGLVVLKYFLEVGFTHSLFMNNSYLGKIVIWEVLSNEGE